MLGKDEELVHVHDVVVVGVTFVKKRHHLADHGFHNGVAMPICDRGRDKNRGFELKFYDIEGNSNTVSNLLFLYYLNEFSCLLPLNYNEITYNIRLL